MRMGNCITAGMVIAFLVLISVTSSSVDAYKNYTVGDSLGWYDRLENSKVDYTKWASSHNFSLGDFLIFNTDNNHSVIQTYNLTTYKLCDYSDALDNDTVEWSSADPSSTAPHSLSVAVPLLKVGETYFFSGDYDGEQCLNGQRFQINVTHGEGLPKSLQPDDDSPSPISPESGDDGSVPETMIPSSFDNPKDIDDDGVEPSGAISLWAFSEVFGVQLHGLVVVVGFFLLSC